MALWLEICALEERNNVDYKLRNLLEDGFVKKTQPLNRIMMWAWLEILGNFTWPCLSPWQSFIFWLNQEISWSCPFTSRVWPWKGFVLGCSLLQPDPAGRIGMSWLALSHTTGSAGGDRIGSKTNSKTNFNIFQHGIQGCAGRGSTLFHGVGYD